MKGPSQYERGQIREALARDPKTRKRPGRRPWWDLEHRMERMSAKHERELVEAAYAEAAQRRAERS